MRTIFQIGLVGLLLSACAIHRGNYTQYTDEQLTAMADEIDAGIIACERYADERCGESCGRLSQHYEYFFQTCIQDRFSEPTGAQRLQEKFQ